MLKRALFPTLSMLLTISLISIASSAKDGFKTLTVAGLEALLNKDKTTSVFDANGDSTRKHVGLVHGAHALSSFDKYPQSELPKDKNTPLVFYCANKMCTASHEAAERAIKFGYTDVSVMVDGVYGWQKAGKPLDKYGAENAKEVSPVEAKKMLDGATAVLLDVREGEERHEVIPHAQWLPLSTDGSPEWNAFVKKLDKSKTVLVHCAMGKRAQKVAEELAQQGFQTSYFRGPDQWKAAGLKVEAGPAH